MYRFFGQPKFAGQATDQAPIGYELFIREQEGDHWVLPKNFNNITVETLRSLLSEVVQTMHESIEMLSFNLEQNQFIDPKFIDMVTDVQDHTNINIFTELTERLAPNITAEQIVRAAKTFHQRGLLVCIDDVGTGQNTPQLVLQMNGSVDEYKFAFQDFRPYDNIGEIEPRLDFWYSLAKKEHKMLALEGVETPSELKELKADYPCDVIQGFLLGHPKLLNSADNSN